MMLFRVMHLNAKSLIYPPTIVVALTEKLQEPKKILSELIVLQHLGT